MDTLHLSRPRPRKAPRYKAPRWASVSDQQRREMISNRAYFIALERNFEGGDALADWLQAEAEVDEHLANQLG